MLLDVVDHLVEWANDAPLLVICLARPELLEERPGWSGGKLNATTTLLQPLSAVESAMLVDNLLGGGESVPDVRDRVAEASDGNPLFAEDMLAMLIDQGELRETNGQWEATSTTRHIATPPTIRAVLTARLDHLGEGERAVLELAAIEGKSFQLSALLELCPSHLRPSVSEHLAALARKQLVRPDRPLFERDQAFAFRHQLIRDAAYDALPKETRSGLHRRFAEWLERAAGERRTEYEEILGYHLEQAYAYRRQLGALDDEARAIAASASGCLEGAAGRAIRRGDVQAAANLLERASSLLENDDHRRPEVLMELGEVLRPVGDPKRAALVFDEVIQAAERTGNDRLAAFAQLERARVDMTLDPVGATERARRAAEDLIPAFEKKEDHLGLARAWLVLNEVDWIRLDLDEVMRTSQLALAEADAAGPEGEQQARTARRYVLPPLTLGPTTVEEGLRIARRAAEGTTDVYLQMAAMLAEAALVAMQEQFDEARTLALQVTAMADDMGARLWAALSCETSGNCDRLAGDLRSAERQHRVGFGKHMDSGNKSLASTSAAYLARLIAEQERYGEAEKWIHTSETLSAEDDKINQFLLHGATARVAAARGEVDEALDHARRGVEVLPPSVVEMRTEAHATLAAVLGRIGRREEAMETYGQALELWQARGNAASIARARRAMFELTSK